jgi:beta-phosphoglucomutase-like phosphatase (HAD superfamily)
MAVIAIDWDHTLMEGKEWLEGAKDALKLFRERGHKIIIHSANEPKWIERNLRDAGIVVDQIWGSDLLDVGKPLCDIYIDDKGFAFSSWDSDLHLVLHIIKNFDNRKWKG